jgi:hypothetical protein
MLEDVMRHIIIIMQIKVKTLMFYLLMGEIQIEILIAESLTPTTTLFGNANSNHSMQISWNKIYKQPSGLYNSQYCR